jgi:hypothetical protein
MLAEGEELGSNLLRVAQRSPWGSGGLPEVSSSPCSSTPPFRPADGSKRRTAGGMAAGGLG